MSVVRSAILLAVAWLAAAQQYSFPQAQAVLTKYCLACHQGKTPSGNFDIARVRSPQSIQQNPRAWTRMLARINNGEMPPSNAPAIPLEMRDQFLSWADHRLRTAACADGITPGPAPMRRLNRAEYAATVRDLLNIHFNAGHDLPADGAGGEGFDNAAETLFLSPIHAEKYLEAARTALEYAFADPRSRSRFMIAAPSSEITPDQAARKILETFLPRAFRRPVDPAETASYLALFDSAARRGEDFDRSVQYALQAVLISPHFLFRIGDQTPTTEPKLIGDYEIAQRLSYFLWGSMPDQPLFELAAKGELQNPAALTAQIERMLKDARTLEFAENFTEQWLGTRELGRDIKPDAKLFPEYWDAETQAAIRYEPIIFFQEILAGNLSLLNLIDSKFTVLNNKLQRHYGIQLKERLRQQPVRVDLPEGTRRGGLLSMAAVLAVSSYPTRTSPVLRGKWVLESLLGTPPPPPPPNVPELPEAHGETASLTLRERLTLHRRNPGCATCHNRIDPMGFALENYDVLGRWRTEDAGKPIDAKGQLPDGETFDGPDELKALLLERKQLLMRNLTAKLLAYALGRGLTLEDYCSVDQITAKLEAENYSSHTLIREIVLSIPFRYYERKREGQP
ncbi:MAG: DUF1592 domain-containing protein [Acidimicrobiia bacterium]|nr:DUF1592 domain-containing protein [Acidimicrobiia bacterium]